MLFTQIEFLLFIIVTFGFILTVRNFNVQKLFLLAMSYYFYGYWDYRFLILIFACTVVNYSAAEFIYASGNQGIRKCVLIFALTFSLGLLGFFKYCNFFIDTFNVLIEPLGLHTKSLRVILPVGISFFTFQTLSYTIDVYNKKIKVCEHFFDFALFVAFFPQLVAGPIVRASEFLPQLYVPRQLSWNRAYCGFEQFVFGFFKKVFIADRIASFVDFSFENHSLFSGGTLWLAVIAYSIQIYCDFSGYSDMAIGIAKAMGYDFNRNFDLPYIAKTVEEFWRRWHISLSTWLRDYLYIPLGGNRKGVRRTYINLFITMLLGGLWHGASWTFVLWGAWHGTALFVHKAFKNRFGDRFVIPAFVSWGITILVVMVGWVFFRSKSFAQALDILYAMATLRSGAQWYHPFVIFVIVMMGVYHIAKVKRIGTVFLYPELGSVYGMTVLFTMLLLTIVFYPQEFQPFIYFQF